MDNDDGLVGRILKRREVLALFGGGGIALLAQCAPATAPASPSSTQQTSATPTGSAAAATSAIPSCVVRPALTEGPYFVEEKLNRSDIRSDPSDGSVRPGARLALTFNVSRVSGSSCTPLSGATVDVWHCDALGVYSDVSDPGFNTTGKKYLRGFQTSDGTGRAEFTTIYPGWYQGRAVHIHFKIRATVNGSAREFTSQLFFDDDFTDKVYAQAPYSQKGARTVRNSGDSIYRGGGSQLLLDVTETAVGNYAAQFAIGLAI